MKKILCLVIAVSMLLCVSVSASALTLTSDQVNSLRDAYALSEGATEITIGEATVTDGEVSVTYSSEKLAGITDAQVTFLVFDAQKPEGSEEEVLPAAGNILAIDQFTYDGSALTFTVPVEAPEGAELVVMMGGTDVDVAASSAVTEETVVPPTPSYVLGDATGNGVIDVFDAVAVLQHIASGSGLTGDNLAAADYTQNSTVDVFDAVAILQTLL